MIRIDNKHIITILVCAIIISLHIPIENTITSVLVNPILSFVSKSWYNDLFFWGIALAVFIDAVRRRRSYKPSKLIVIYELIGCAFYLYYRNNGPWDFTTTQLFANVKYADLILVFTLANVALLFWPIKKPKRVSNQHLQEGLPITSENDDFFGYSDYAKVLVGKINSEDFEKSFAIGINGKWGEGKTSFIKLMRNHLGSNFIQVEFNPWKSNNAARISFDFFQELKDAIPPSQSSLGNKLKAYSTNLIESEETWINKILGAIINSNISTETLFKEIDEEVKNLQRTFGKRVIIFIDDLDRLDKDEILETLKLIRSTANFGNTIFLVAYDRNYIIRSLEGLNTTNKESFLEKFFQLEITLPLYNKVILREKLAEKLKSAVSPEHHSVIEREINPVGYPPPDYLLDWVENMRDVNRLSNSIILNWSRVSNDVDFYDFLRLEVLRTKFPGVYQLLASRPKEFLEAKQAGPHEFKYQLKGMPVTEQTKSKYSTKLENYISENLIPLSVPDNKVNQVGSFISSIFNDSFIPYTSYRTHLSVVHPSKFHRYFYYQLQGENIPELLFKEAKSGSIEVFKEKVATWFHEGKARDLNERFYAIDKFDGREDFEKIIDVLFHYAKLHYGIRINTQTYNIDDLVGKMNNYDDNIERKFYKSAKQGDYNQFISNLFSKAESPFLFESDLAYRLSIHPSKKFGITEEQIHTILLKYFRVYSSSTRKLDAISKSLYFNCKKGIKIDRGNSFSIEEEYLAEVNQIMGDLIEWDLDAFLYWIIEPEPFHGKLFGIGGQFISNQFGGWEKFKHFIDEEDIEKWNYLKEFREFFSAFEKERYERSVGFQFKTIPIHQKLGRRDDD